MLRQAQGAVKAAIADRHEIIEVDFPVGSLLGVAGDGEGQNEMNGTMKYLRKFLTAFSDQAESTRVFFPDNKELDIAVTGQSMDPGAGRAELDPIFANTKFKLGYLTKQNAAWALFGVNFDKWSPVQLVKETDKLLFVAYPSFNPKEELGATLELYQQKAKTDGIPIVIFNGELDRLRGGYYSPLFFPTIGKITEGLLPNIMTAYYVHNFKGSRPGVLFRCYPGPWTVMRRNPSSPDETRIIWTSDQPPTLKQVSLEILASNL
ncbi:hypothetical protein FOA52_006430 [Chlamydomonas sp. UWO 241]|nr:hypothetical protein FOA52_006430 [Chlamydomonas sp. UWO 241]